jgi:autophagy-related protein 5
MSEIVKNIWSSQITCIVNYNSSLNNRSSLYLLAYRNSYLYTILPKVFNYFDIPISKLSQASFISKSTNNYIDWYIPLDIAFLLNNSQNDLTFEIDLSLNISSISSIISFQHQLQTQSILEVLEKYWRNKIKESCYILNGSSNLVMSMSLETSKIFWNSVINRNYSEFEKISRKLIPINFKNIPIIIYKLDENLNYQQSIISMLKLFPDLSMHEITLNMIINRLLEDNIKSIKIHGITPPLDVPVDSFYSKLKYFDMFLHIIIHI